MEEIINVHTILIGKPERKTPLYFGCPGVYESTTKYRKGVNRVHMAQDGAQWWAPVDTVIKLRLPKRRPAEQLSDF
jgi:hypothetical protein